MYSSARCHGITRGGLPHSEISGSTRLCRSPKLIAACHVLLRLLAPRHSFRALGSLVLLSPVRLNNHAAGTFPSPTETFPGTKLCLPVPARPVAPSRMLPSAGDLLLIFSCLSVKELLRLARSPAKGSAAAKSFVRSSQDDNPTRFTCFTCFTRSTGPDWARTSDPALIKRML